MKRFNGKRLISHEGINPMTGSNETRLQTEDGVKIALFNYAGHCQSAANAINNHDALVEALGSAIHELMFLAEFYNKAQRSNVTSYQLDPPEVYDYQSIHEYIQAWKKAKGES